MSQAPSGTNYGAMFGTGFALAGASALTTGIDAILGSREAKKRVIDYIAQEKTNSLLATERLAREAQRALGATLNVMPEGQSALETIASRIVMGAATDQFAIDEELRRRVRAAKMEMKSIDRGVGQAVGSAAASGFTAGVGLYQQKQELQHEQQTLEAYKKIFEQQSAQSEIQTQATRQDQEAAQMQAAYYRSLYEEAIGEVDSLRNSPHIQTEFGRVFQPLIDKFFSPFQRGSA